ncbi:MAG: hypothetical protein AB1758_23695, partial [Candidatus Eremiobacterota bacterium]
MNASRLLDEVADTICDVRQCYLFALPEVRLVAGRGGASPDQVTAGIIQRFLEAGRPLVILDTRMDSALSTRTD